MQSIFVAIPGPQIGVGTGHSMMAVADFIVDTGDAAVLLPIAILIFLVLWLAGDLRGSLVWALAIGSCGAAIGVLKLVSYACAPALLAAGLRSPSGHAGLATAVYGSLALMMIGRVSHTGVKIGAASLVIVWIAAIAVSSVAIHAHSAPEVVLGVVVGAAAVLFIRAKNRREGEFKGRLSVVMLVAVIALVVLHGQRVEAEGTMERWAALIGRSTGCAVLW
jgi:membrane-associated phospholipid phosphatase